MKFGLRLFPHKRPTKENPEVENHEDRTLVDFTLGQTYLVE
jgi:hypothetical protein